jgi:transmembrane sensor
VFHNSKAMKKKQDYIDEIVLLKVLENRADEKEIVLFDSWIEASAKHTEIFEQLKKIYQLTSIDQNSLKKNWGSVVSKIKEGKVVPDYIKLPVSQPILIRIKLNTLIRVAAALVILLGISFLLKLIVFGPEQLTISGNDLNPKDPYQLVDGSLVYLNKNSEISFSKRFGSKNRKLLLKGEAFFEVKRNENIPFIITTYKTTTQVFGTSFNIYSDQSEQVRVSVVSGIVEFSAAKGKDKVRLVAGERGIYNPGIAGVKKEKITDRNFLAWNTGILYFNETPLTEAFRLLQTQYSRVFVFETKKDDLPTLTTTFENLTLEAVLEELNLLLNTKNVIRNDTIIFKPVV